MSNVLTPRCFVCNQSSCKACLGMNYRKGYPGREKLAIGPATWKFIFSLNSAKKLCKAFDNLASCCEKLARQVVPSHRKQQLLRIQILQKFFPDMFCMKRVYRDTKRRYTGQQPGTKSAFRPGDKPVVNRGFCSSVGLHTISLVRASEESFRTVFSICWRARGRLVPWPDRPNGAQS